MTKTATKIAVLYTLFAVLSTAINIGSQMLSIWMYEGALSVVIFHFCCKGNGFDASLFSREAIYLQLYKQELSARRQIIYFLQRNGCYNDANFLGH